MSSENPDAIDERRPIETLNNNPGDSTNDKILEPSTSSNHAGPDPGTQSSDALARAISSMLGGAIGGFDSRAEHVVKSQEELSSALDRLMRELDKLLEDAPLPFIMQHAAKLLAVRKRVSSLNLLLKSVQRRIDNIDRMISESSSHENALPNPIRQSLH